MLNQSDTPRKTLAQRAMTAALYSTGIGIALGLIFYVAGLNETMMRNPALNWANNFLLFAVAFYFIYTAAKTHRDHDLGGYLSVGQGLGLGTLAGLISGLINAVWIVIFMNFIASDMADQIKQVTMEQMEKQGLSEEQIEQNMEFASFFMSPVFLAIATVFFMVFIGFLSGLISGLMLKKDRPTL